MAIGFWKYAKSELNFVWTRWSEVAWCLGAVQLEAIWAAEAEAEAGSSLSKNSRV